MKLHIDSRRTVGVRDRMIYGQFLEHFHRVTYGGVFDPGSPFSDGVGIRQDVVEALRRLNVPIVRWPGGCFVSDYHWRDGVGPERRPFYDKAWRVEDPNTFGTDEFVAFCRQIGAEPYICTNAGTGTIEEMSDWLEYCNLDHEGSNARLRISNGYREPHAVKYWSIGNENWGAFEMGSKTSEEWGRLTVEAAKLMKRVDPEAQLSAAALPDAGWNLNLLEHCGAYLDWISVHQYWDPIFETNDTAGFEQVVAQTANLDSSIRRAKGILEATGCDGHIRLAMDEWNLRGWYHPNIFTVKQRVDPAEYLTPRDRNDDNSLYTMADAVFSACFLNELHRYCRWVGMGCFSPTVNGRGCIFTHPDGIVLRPTYHVFELYGNHLGDVVLDSWGEGGELLHPLDRDGNAHAVDVLDVVATAFSDEPGQLALAVVSKDPSATHDIELDCPGIAPGTPVTTWTLNGSSPDAYNDIGVDGVTVCERAVGAFAPGMRLSFEPHSVTIVGIG